MGQRNVLSVIMQSSVIITIVGPDRPGLVESISRTVENAAGNWTHGRMAHLGGQFAGMLQIDTQSGQVDELVAALKQLESSDDLTITVVVGGSSGSAEQYPNGSGEVANLELVGQDRPGIVRNITAAVAARGANIEDLATECFSAPMSGETMFRATARLHLPANSDLSAIQSDLEEIAVDLMVEIKLDHDSA
jgi:glycine cleavage system regulatory protein